jgi:hypothetical protein
MEGQFNVSTQSLIFEYGIDSNKCSEGLGFDHFYLQFPCNPLIEDYTEVFYMIHEGDVPSVQCKVSLRWSKTTREVDRPSISSLILMFQHSRHVSIELRPRCSFLSYNPLCEPWHRSVIGNEGQINTWYLGLSFIYILYNVGNSTKP